MTDVQIPLKHLALLNPETLGEDTDLDRPFHYIDIATTGRGVLLDEPEAMTFATSPSRARRVLRPGDTILSTVRTYLRAGWTHDGTDDDLVASTGFVCLRPRPGTDPRFLGWLAQADTVVDEVVARSVGVSYPAINASDVGRIKVALPPMAKQRAIADYLDRETARIDALVAAKRKVVALLEERRGEVATHHLLGPPVARGAAGPGQVTLRAGWTLVPFRRLFREVDVRSQKGSEMLLSVSQTRGVIPQAELGERRQYAETLAGYKLCSAGDLVVNRMWVYYGALGAAPVAGIVSPDYAVFRPIAEMSSEFAAYVLRTQAYVGEMTRLVRGIGAAFQGSVRKPRLHPSEMGLIELPFPPASDQQRLLRELDHANEAITRRVSLVDLSIELLKERRQALITAAVTGKLDIREAA